MEAAAATVAFSLSSSSISVVETSPLLSRSPLLPTFGLAATHTSPASAPTSTSAPAAAAPASPASSVPPASSERHNLPARRLGRCWLSDGAPLSVLQK